MNKRNVLKVISASLVLAMATAPMTPVADFFNVGTTITVNAVVGDIITSGEYWTAYETATQGECEIVLKGTLTNNFSIKGVSRIDWSSIHDAIGNNTIKKISAEANTKFVADCYIMFYDASGYLRNVTEIDLSNVDTSKVTSMQNMFSDCSALQTLNLSSFNTSKVTNMEYMFSDCSALQTLNLSNFNTSNVITMNGMFKNCKNLTSLDLSSFDTSNVYNTKYMFENCKKLTSLDLSSFDTSNAVYMKHMFCNCKSLETITVSGGWNAKNSTDYYSNDACMFSGCSALKGGNGTEYDENHIEKEWAVIDFDNNHKGYLTSCYEEGKFGTWWGISGNKLYIFGDMEYDDKNPAPFAKYKDSITEVYTYKSAKAGASVSGLFAGLRNVTKIDASGMDVSAVENMSEMFKGCVKAETIVIGKWSVTNVTNTTEMFAGCKKLKNIFTEEFVDFSNVEQSDGIFTGCVNLTGGLGTTCNANCTDRTYAHFDKGSENPGYFSSEYWYGKLIDSEKKEYEVILKGTLTKYSDLNGVPKIDWANIQSIFGDGTIKKISADEDTKFVADCTYMFYSGYGYLGEVTEIDLSNVDTSDVTGMGWMFDSCHSLTNLNISSFDTSKVTTMSQMFDNCQSLTSLDLRHFDTSNVTEMDCMFYKCYALKNLDLRNFNTSNVTSMTRMFGYCQSLTSLNLSSFDTSAVTNMNYMFSGCESLTSLNLSNFDTSAVTDMEYMFYNCSSLRKITIGNNFSIDSNAYLENTDNPVIKDYWYKGETVISDTGDYAVIGKNNAGTIVRHLNINLWNYNDIDLPVLDDVVYNNEPVTFDNIHLTAKQIYPLIEGLDYTTEYANNEYPGLATITFTGIGDFEGCETLEENFIILPRAMKASLSSRKKIGKNTKITLSGEWHLPKEATDIKGGIARLSTDEAGITKYDVFEKGIYKTSAVTSTNAKYSYSLTMNSTNSDKNLYAVTYVTYKIGDKEFTSISDMASSIIHEPVFELFL